MESDLDGLVVVEVRELLRLLVGEEEEIGAATFGDCHTSTNWTYALPEGGHKPDLEAIDRFVEFFNLAKRN